MFPTVLAFPHGLEQGLLRTNDLYWKRLSFVSRQKSWMFHGTYHVTNKSFHENMHHIFSWVKIKQIVDAV